MRVSRWRAARTEVTEVARRATGGGVIVLLRADITTLDHDALVNAANSHLAGGGGVDGAIHRAGGPAIMAELRQRYDRCDTGSAVITGAGRLAARHVIHAVGPRWRDGAHGEPGLLRSAYATAFTLAADAGCARVATASLSTGIYGFPVEQAAPIGLEAARDALHAEAPPLQEIAWALFSDRDVTVYGAALESLEG